MRMRLFLAACLLALTAGSVNADTINVLWYTGGSSGDGNYQSTLSGLAANSVASGGNTWNMQFWDGTGSMPTPGSGSWNVIVASSDVSFRPDFTGLTNYLSNNTVGDRVMVSGQDADYHYIANSGTGAGGNAQTSFNSAQGFLVDAINWAGSGTGTGLVLEGDDAASLYATSGNAALSGLGNQSGLTGLENVNIPSAYSSYPINAGLTSAGLSNWGNSYHYYWEGSDTSKWTTINTSGDVSGAYVTLVSAGTAGAPTTPAAVPEPASLALLGIATAGLAGYGWRRRKVAMAV